MSPLRYTKLLLYKGLDKLTILVGRFSVRRVLGKALTVMWAARVPRMPHHEVLAILKRVFATVEGGAPPVK